MKTNELTQWLTLDTRVMSEPLVTAPVAVLVGETRDNMDSVLKRGTELLKHGHVRRLVLPSRESEQFGFAGVDYCIQHLEGAGIDPEVMDVMPHDQNMGNPHTMTELICFVRCAREVGIRRAVLVAAPFHQLRSFVTGASVALKEYPQLIFYNQVGYPLDWNGDALHSQGTIQGNRVRLFAGEIERIIRYQDPANKPYPLASVEEVLGYMDRRQ